MDEQRSYSDIFKQSRFNFVFDKVKYFPTSDIYGLVIDISNIFDSPNLSLKNIITLRTLVKTNEWIFDNDMESIIIYLKNKKKIGPIYPISVQVYPNKFIPQKLKYLDIQSNLVDGILVDIVIELDEKNLEDLSISQKFYHTKLVLEELF